MGLRDTLLRLYTWIKLAYTRLCNWNTRYAKEREERTRLRRENELTRLAQESEALEAQLKTLRLENQVAEQKRQIKRVNAS